MLERSWGSSGRALKRGRCPACGYAVEGLPGTTCPECGSDWANPNAPPGPRPPRAARLGTILAFLLILLTAVMQQTCESAAVKSAAEGAAPAASGISPPHTVFEVLSKVLTRLYFADPDSAKDPAAGKQVVDLLDKQAHGPADQFRVTVVAGEVESESA